MHGGRLEMGKQTVPQPFLKTFILIFQDSYDITKMSCVRVCVCVTEYDHCGVLGTVDEICSCIYI